MTHSAQPTADQTTGQTRSQKQPSPADSYLHQAAKYFDRMGRINLWSGVAGMRHMEQEQDSHRKNREAEEQHVRKTVWGYDEPQTTHSETDKPSESESVGHTILGDIQQPAPIVVTQPQTTNNVGWVLPAVLGAAIPLGMGAAGLATYFAMRQPSKPTQYVDESVQMGLGQIEDYLPKP